MGNFPSYVGVAICFFGFVIMFATKGVASWRVRNLLIGILLIVLASLAFGMFTDMGNLFDKFSSNKQIDDATHEYAKRMVGVWVFALPAVLAALGVNLVSAWFAAKKPEGLDANAKEGGGSKGDGGN